MSTVIANIQQANSALSMYPCGVIAKKGEYICKFTFIPITTTNGFSALIAFNICCLSKISSTFTPSSVISFTFLNLYLSYYPS